MNAYTRGFSLFVMLLASLAGCGYHLRGSTGDIWNLGRLYIRNLTPVALQVQRQLTLANVPITGNAADADTILTFTHESPERQVISVDPDTGKVREYELTVDTGIKVTRADGTVLMQDDSIALQRDYTFDEATVIGTDQQETTLYAEIREDLASAIVRRLQALHPPAADAASK